MRPQIEAAPEIEIIDTPLTNLEAHRRMEARYRREAAAASAYGDLRGAAYCLDMATLCAEQIAGILLSGDDEWCGF